MPNKVGKQIIGALLELRDALAAGEKISEKLTCRRVKLKLRPTRYNAELVRTTRRKLGVSQAIFAEFIGVSTNCVQAWEQGLNPVTGAPARLMDEIRQNPQYWRQRVLEMAAAADS
jgi:putative transcriptional regulator